MSPCCWAWMSSTEAIVLRRSFLRRVLPSSSTAPLWAGRESLHLDALTVLCSWWIKPGLIHKTQNVPRAQDWLREGSAKRRRTLRQPMRQMTHAHSLSLALLFWCSYLTLSLALSLVLTHSLAFAPSALNSSKNNILAAGGEHWWNSSQYSAGFHWEMSTSPGRKHWA